MIEKILERLEEEKEIAYADFDKYANDYELDLDDSYDDFFHKGLARAKEIVQEESKNGGWIPCSEQMPPKAEVLLLVQCSGKPRKNVILRNAFELAIYDGQRWHFPMYPVWDDAEVIAWQPLPAIYEKGQ